MLKIKLNLTHSAKVFPTKTVIKIRIRVNEKQCQDKMVKSASSDDKYAKRQIEMKYLSPECLAVKKLLRKHSYEVAISDYTWLPKRFLLHGRIKLMIKMRKGETQLFKRYENFMLHCFIDGNITLLHYFRWKYHRAMTTSVQMEILQRHVNSNVNGRNLVLLQRDTWQFHYFRWKYHNTTLFQLEMPPSVFSVETLNMFTSCFSIVSETSNEIVIWNC